jgi:hypothetical protein
VDLGDTLTFKSDLYDKPPDQGGVLVNAPTVTLTITLPDGSTVLGSVQNPPATTGKYLYDYTTSVLGLAGRYVGRWLFTLAGGKTTSYVEAFDVGASLVSVDEAMAHLRAVGIITTADDLDQLQWLTFVATDAIERDLARVLVRRTIVETHDGGRWAIVLRQQPVISITSVTETGVTLSSVSGYVLDTFSGVLSRGSWLVPTRFWPGRQNIVVTYVAGETNAPPIARKVALNTIQGMWQQSQQAPHPAMAEFAGNSTFVDTSSLTPVERDAYNSLRIVGIA